jgi:ribosomal protein S27AE
MVKKTKIHRRARARKKFYQEDAGGGQITREQWSADHNWCFRCGGGLFLETHEMVRGCNRSVGLLLPAAWLRLCNACHRIVEAWPVAKQLALKEWRDPEHYDRVAVNVARGRQPEAITEAEVEEHLP